MAVSVNGGGAETFALGPPRCPSPPTTCGVSIPVPAGNDLIVLTLSGYSTPVAIASTTILVQPPYGQALHVIFHGIVHNAQVTIDNPHPPVGVPATARVGVLAYDVDHNQITGDDFASPVKLSITNASPAVRLSGTVLTNPASTVALSYTGAATRPVSISAEGGSVTQFFPNAFREFGPFTIPVRFVARGGDGNVWFLEIDNIGHRYRIGRVTPAGVTTEFTPPGSVAEITAGPGAMWFTDGVRGAVGRITYDGKITEFPVVSDPGIDPPQSITLGPDGNLWFTTSYEIGKITPLGQVSLYSVGLIGPFSILAGPDGNLWWAANQRFGRTTPSGQNTTFFLGNSIALNARMVFRPDRKLYFIASFKSGQGLYSFDLAGHLALVKADGSFGSQLAVDPGGSLWAAYATNPSYGMYVPGVGNITFPYSVFLYPFIEQTPNQMSADSVAFGPDGNIWYADARTMSVGRVQIH
jgi:streptogramin lyase